MGDRNRARPRFTDRRQAGIDLAADLRGSLHEQGVMVLAIPADGVPVAGPVVSEMEARIDLIVSTRIVAPSHTGETLGAITPDRTLVVNGPLVKQLGLTDDEVEELAIPAWAEAQRAMQRYRGSRPYPDLRGCTVVLVDDGLTTGYTMMAAVVATRKLEPARLIIAVPVAAIEAIERLSSHVDEIVSLEISSEADFSVARYYAHYPVVRDQEVGWTLDHFWKERPPEGYSETF